MPLLMMRNILITGSNGYIGSTICSSLQYGNRLFGIDITPPLFEDYNFNIVDLSDFEEAENYFKNHSNIDYIIHSAALAHKKGSNLTFNRFKVVNFEITKNLVDLANKYLSLKKFIFFSTISVYGEKSGKAVYSENDELEPKNPYAITKMMAEKYIIDKAIFDYIIFRFAPVYGNDFSLNIDRRTQIKNFIYQVGLAKNRLSLLNINNIIDIVRLFIEHPDILAREIINVADQSDYSFIDLVNYQKKKYPDKFVIKIPRLLIKAIYHFGLLIRNNFITENSNKLLSDSIYDTSKISKIHLLKYALKDLI